MSISEIQRIVFNELAVENKYILFQGQRSRSELWLRISGALGATDRLIIMVAPCKGGAYSQFATGVIEPQSVTLEVKTVSSIIQHKSYPKSTHSFCYEEPGFPQNLIDFLKMAADNARRAFDLSHRRSWRTYRRSRHLYKKEEL